MNVEPIPNAVTASASVGNDIYVVPVSLNVEPLPNVAAPVSNSITPIHVDVGTAQASHTNLVSATPEVNNHPGVEQSKQAVAYSKSYGVVQTTTSSYVPQPTYAPQPMYVPDPTYAPQPNYAAPVIYTTQPSRRPVSRAESLAIQRENW